jgi:hypothetical protein
MMESAVEDSSSKSSFREHAFDEGFEFDKTMVQFSRNRSLKLELIRLETENCQLVVKIILSSSTHS